MPKIKFLLLFLISVTILSGCGSSEEDYQNACFEVGETKAYQSSKRIDILKSVGGLSSLEAVTANKGIEAVHQLIKLNCSPDMYFKGGSSCMAAIESSKSKSGFVKFTDTLSTALRACN